MDKFLDWLSRPVTWVTVIIAALGAAMVVLACPLGLSVSEQGGDAWVAICWAGVVYAQLISLGVWVALRDAPLLSRVPVPAALLLMHIVASAVGERINSEPADVASAVACISVFGTACELFLVLRAMGWRIGPSNQSSIAFSLSQLFLATAYIAVGMAIWTWAATDIKGQTSLASELMDLSDVFRALMFGALTTLILCLLVAPTVGLVMKGGKRYSMLLISALAVAILVVVP